MIQNLTATKERLINLYKCKQFWIAKNTIRKYLLFILETNGKYSYYNSKNGGKILENLMQLRNMKSLQKKK